MKYENMSIAQLEVEINGLNNDMTLIRETKAKVAKILDDKIVLQEALRKTFKLSAQERKALEQTLSPEGIQSEERVGFIGRLLERLK